MKSFALIFFILSISCIIIGYMELKIMNKKNEKSTEYRVVPKEMIETQFKKPTIDSSLNYLFYQPMVSII